MSRYAEKTSVSSAQSRAEIEKTLTRYGADQFAYGWQGENATVGFRMHDRYVRFDLVMPDRGEREFTHTPARGTRRSAEQQDKAYDQAVRQRWRALALVIKAKLEAVESGITEFEEEFLAHILMPDGQTVGRHAIPMITEAYKTGRTPKLLAM